MKTSVCITVFNEEKSISKLIESLSNQTVKPGEIIIVDAESKDKTVSIIHHWQKKDKRIKLLTKKCSRSEGRNLSIELAKNEIIAVTDAGCIPRRDWLERLTRHFKNKNVEMVAGFYKMIGNSPIQKAFSVFLGVHESNFDKAFLPSTRSIAFTKKFWEEIGGFPENLEDTAEDTVFNIKALEHGVKMAHEKGAVVEWKMPETITEGIKKMYSYAKGDAKSKVWKHPSKGYGSHNVKALTILIRYLFGLFLLIYSYWQPVMFYILCVAIMGYIMLIFRNIYYKVRDWRAGMYGILIKLTSDIAIITGLLQG